MEHECVHARGGLVGARLNIDYPDAGSRSHVLRPFEDHHHARIHATWLLPWNPTYHIVAGVPGKSQAVPSSRIDSLSALPPQRFRE